MMRPALHSALAMQLGLLATDAVRAADRPADAASPAASWIALRFDLARAGIADATPVVPAQPVENVSEFALSSRVVGGVVADQATWGGAEIGSGRPPSFRREASVTGRLGIVVGSHGLVYGRAGYEKLDTDVGRAAAASARTSFAGYSVGAGTEVRVTPALSLRTEYRFVDYAAYSPSTKVTSGLSLRF